MPNRFRIAPAVVLGVVIALLQAPALAQFPHPRLQSANPPGGTAGESIDVTLAGGDLEGVSALWFDHPGLRGFHLKALTFRVAIAPGTPIGPHDVRAVGPLGVSNPRIFVVGDRPEQRETEPNNQPAQANPIALDTVVNGDIGGTDIDCFAFEGRKDQHLFLELWAARIDSRLDPLVHVYGPDGRQLAESEGDSGPDPLLDLTLPADGRYTIKLHDMIYAGSPDHYYRLLLHNRPHIDAILPAAAPPGVATTFTLLGRNLGGQICPELKVHGQLLERKEVTISTPPAQEPDPVSPATELLPSLAATRRGFHYRFEGSTGTSNAVFIAAANDPVVLEHEPNDDSEHAQAVSLPCDISGSFASVGDYDVYRFQGHKGDIWWIEVSAERLGSLADPVFVVQKVVEKGAPQDLASGDDLADSGGGTRFSTGSVDAALRWQVPDEGVYQVVVNDLYNSQRGDARLTYRLNIRPERPDFALFVVPQSPNAMEALAVRAGGRASAYVLAARRDGFNRPIHIEARDLPPGVRCDPVVIGPGQSQAPITFEAAEAALPRDGVARLIGWGLSADRKDILDYVKGMNIQRPEPSHEALPGGMTWPPTAPNGQLSPGPARLTRGFVVSVREGAAFLLKVQPAHWDVAPGSTLELNVELVRRAGFTEAVQLAAIDLPPNMANANSNIAKDKTATVVKLPIAANVPPGTYTFLIQGTGPFPFSKDPNAKQKPNVNAIEPSNPVTLTIRK